MDASNANGTANPYHITCGSDNDLMVSTVTYGSLFHYDRQTDTWTDHASEVKHCVGVGFSPSADAYSLCYHSDNADSTENYQLLKLPCDTLDDRGHGEAPGCSKYADNFEAVKVRWSRCCCCCCFWYLGATCMVPSSAVIYVCTYVVAGTLFTMWALPHS